VLLSRVTFVHGPVLDISNPRLSLSPAQVNHPDDPSWILYFPMVRAASKAMDAVSSAAA
jgi:hypothetical protein